MKGIKKRQELPAMMLQRPSNTSISNNRNMNLGMKSRLTKMFKKKESSLNVRRRSSIDPDISIVRFQNNDINNRDEGMDSSIYSLSATTNSNHLCDDDDDDDFSLCDSEDSFYSVNEDESDWSSDSYSDESSTSRRGGGISVTSFSSSVSCSSNSAVSRNGRGQRRLNFQSGKLYGRDKEIKRLKKLLSLVVRRREATVTWGSRSHVVLVEGPSGIGKSALVEHTFMSVPCLFIKGTFERQEVDQPERPFAAFGAVVVNLIDQLEHNEVLADTLSKRLQEDTSSMDRKVLVQTFPEISSILPRSGNMERNNADDDEWICQSDVHYRVMMALRSFFRVVTSSSKVPVVICLDDLLYADGLDTRLIGILVDDQEQSNSLFVLTYCNDAIKQTCAFESWRNKRTECYSIITLEGLSIVGVNYLLADAVGQAEGKTFPLSYLLMMRTGGNAFFVIQLLDHLQNQGLLFYDVAKSEWAWDLHEVQSTSLAEQVVDLISDRIQQHPTDIQQVLSLMACLGSKVDPNVIEAVKGALLDTCLNISKAIRFCLKERLLTRLFDGRVMFSHAKVLQATVSLLPTGAEKAKLHLRIGTHLWNYIQHLKKNQYEVRYSILFSCADHLFLGREFIDGSIMKLKLAQLNLNVGKRAVQLSAFATAATYFEQGIEIFDRLESPQSDVYLDLRKKLLLLHAETLCSVGQFDLSLISIARALSTSTTDDDKIHANLLRLFILKSDYKLQEFVDSAFRFLRELGENLQAYPDVVVMLESYTNEDILGLPKLEKRNKIAVSKVLVSMVVPLQTLGFADMSAHVISRAVEISVVDGISSSSPQAFALYGATQISKSCQLAEGYRFGELALGLSMNQCLTSEVNSKVFQCVYTMTQHWQLTPLSKCVNLQFRGYDASMSIGDSFSAFSSVANYFDLSYCSGLDLRPLLNDVECFASQMLHYGQKTLYLSILPLWQCILNLTGKTDNILDMATGKALNFQLAIGEVSAGGELDRWSFLMQIAFYMGNLELATQMSRKLQDSKLGIREADVMHPCRVFFFGLISIANARKNGKRKHKVEAARHVSTMRTWVQLRAGNLAHKLLILEAEFEQIGSSLSSERLRKKYDKAVAAATKSGFVQDAALASQLAGRMLMKDTEVMHYADLYIRKSRALYKSWGALAVADKIKEENTDMFDKRYASVEAERGNFLSRERFDLAVSQHHQRVLTE